MGGFHLGSSLRLQYFRLLGRCPVRYGVHWAVPPPSGVAGPIAGTANEIFITGGSVQRLVLALATSTFVAFLAFDP